MGEAKALEIRASAIVATGSLTEGRKVATGALAAYRDARDKLGQATVCCLIANIDVMKEDFDQAVRRALEAADTFAKAQDISKQADALLSVSNAYISRIGY